MVLYAVAAKEVILCKSHKSLVKILGSFTVLELDFWKIKEMRSGGFEAEMHGLPNGAQ